MNRILKLALCCVAALGLVAALAGCSSESYTPPTKTAVVDTPVIGVSKTLRVGVDTGSSSSATESNAPFASQVSGRVVGMDVDMAAAIADEMGLDLQIIDVGSDPQSAIANGEVDIVMGLDGSDTNVSCWLSDPYVETSTALFAPESTTSAPSAASSPKIAAQSSTLSAWEVNNQFGDTAVVSAKSLTDAFAAMDGGSADYVAGDAVIGTYVVESGGYDAHIVALLNQPSGYCIGVSSSNTDLQNAVSSALRTVMGNGVGSVVVSKWLGESIDLSNVPVTATKPAAGDDSASSTESSSESSSSSSSQQSLDEVLAEGQNANGETASGDGSEAGANAVSMEEATGEPAAAEEGE